MKRNILIVDDDVKILDLIRQTMKKEGYEVKTAPSLSDARKLLKAKIPDIIILDRMLPDGDGLQFCNEIRKGGGTKNIPILFLTAKAGGADRVIGLKMGGDDYLPKPFLLEELLARIEVILRRSALPAGKKKPILRMEGVVLDLDKHECQVGGVKIDLWPKEFKLLQLFMDNPSRSLSKEFIAKSIWSTDIDNMVGSRAMDVTIQRLRSKLGKWGNLIKTVRGYGFSFGAKKRK
jgi:DNA-binding response OmpR family regulator